MGLPSALLTPPLRLTMPTVQDAKLQHHGRLTTVNHLLSDSDSLALPYSESFALPDTVTPKAVQQIHKLRHGITQCNLARKTKRKPRISRFRGPSTTSRARKRCYNGITQA
jgi:hypothetical protein